MRPFLTIILVLFLSTMLTAQEPFPSELTPNFFEGGLGVTWIDGVSYTTISLTPEFTFGKFGLGLRIELLFNNQDNFKFRTTGWDDAAAIARAIRYVRYGHKGNPFYARIGSIPSATIGHGFIMWHYSNEAYYDQRKFGAVLDVDFNHVGFETGVNDLESLEIYAGRLYVRPIYFLEIPILSNLELGGSYVADRNPDGDEDTKDELVEWGLDVGLPLVKTELFKTILYFDYAKFKDYGEGKAAGVNFGFPNVLNVFSLDAKIERRWIGDQFIPNYFNTLYELERRLPPPQDKRSLLAITPKSKGIFGELSGHIANMLRLVGSYQYQDGVPYSGLLHLEARLMDLVPNVRLIAYYDKTNIEKFKDVRTLDIYSQAVAELGYVTYGILMISLRYRWNFIEVTPGVYKPQERFEPRVSLVYDF